MLGGGNLGKGMFAIPLALNQLPQQSCEVGHSLHLQMIQTGVVSPQSQRKLVFEPRIKPL